VPPGCGDPLRVDDQTLKGDLEDKAKFLSSLVGNANLKGQIEASVIPLISSSWKKYQQYQCFIIFTGSAWYIDFIAFLSTNSK